MEMRAQAIQRAQKRLCRHVRSRYELIKPAPTQGMFNARCFENAVEYARQHSEDGLEVVEVIYIDNGEPVLHYINRVPETGAYLETTLGWRADLLEYYFIRRIHPDDHRHIHSEFSRALDDWTYQFTSWFDRNYLLIKRIL